MQEMLVEQFATDEQGTENESGIKSRMFSPTDANDWLKERGSDLADLLCRNAGKVNLISLDGAEGEGNFAIAPNPALVADSKGRISQALKDQGHIRLTSNARKQLCKLLGVGRGWERYKGMHMPEKRLISDFKGRYSGDAGEKSPLVFRTSTIDGQRQIEGIVPQSADRTDENTMVRTAMAAIIKEVGCHVRGVEFLDDPRNATRSFRIIFGNPCFDYDAVGGSAHVIDYRDKIFPAIDMRLSATNAVTPEVTLGIWRLICRNAAMDELCAAAKWSGGSADNMEAFAKSMQTMAKFAVPFGNMLGARCEAIYDAPLTLEPAACLDKLVDLNAIKPAHGEAAQQLFEDGYGDGIHNGHGQWGMFNALTDAAKDLSKIQSRRSAESRAMTLALQKGGFNGVCENGLNIRQSRLAMKGIVENSKDLNDILVRAAVNN